MCLLHTHPATTVFNEDDIKDFYDYNSDGVGVMWADNGILYTQKYLPKSASAAWMFYQEHILGKDCVVHWRMKTHGLIDLENCHPYSIFGDGTVMPMALMHNGILSTGNDKDKTKSDTWHYVADYLRPLLQDHPDMMMNEGLKRLIESHIGHGNRFIILNHKGDQVVFNEDDFVDYKGAKLSNTYAWSSEKGGYGYSSRKVRSMYDYDAYEGYVPSTTAGSSRPPSTDRSVREMVSSFFQMLKELGFNEAYQELSFSEVENIVEDAHFMFAQFIHVVEQEYLDDEGIIDCVRDVEGVMVPYLYGVDEDEEVVDDGRTDGDIHREQILRDRVEEQERLRQELAVIAEVGAN